MRVRFGAKMRDGLYRAEWVAIVDIVAAVQSGSPERIVEQLRRWVVLKDANKVSVRRQGIYQMFLLEECLKHVVDAPFTAPKLADIGEQIYPVWTRLARLDRSDLILILNERADLNEEGERLNPEKAYLGVIIALALISANANVEVGLFRPALAKFCKEQPDLLRHLEID